MGKALDILFDYERGGRAQQKEDLDTIRKDYFEKYLNATYWTGSNNFGLETYAQGAKTWVHVDVREFESQYLEDKYFCKTESELNGKGIVQLARDLGYSDTCSCLFSFNSSKSSSDEGCKCLQEGLVSEACNGKGTLISNEVYEKEAKRIGIEVAMIQAIAKQESKRNSFWEEGQATILFERHKMWEYLKKDLNKTDEELIKLKEQDSSIVNNTAGGYGKYSEQYTKLEKAKKLDYTTALKACSWGKFQVMGFNYAVKYSSPEEMEKAVNMCELQQFYFFLGYLENTSGMIQAIKNKNWESIASKYNGSNWKNQNPDYAINIEKYYNEFKK